ncbi:MAG TPA: sulfite exporter TauE/SafE family protein, partial [Candidatus Eisenbacteria bacterium]|nr:sulfite exporter TauE/SafE family protein [Candidatus Eisenbacteria bacterium]
MSLETAVYSGLVVFLAYWVRGMAGFGSGLIAVPLLTLMWPVTLVVPVVVALDYLGSASQGIGNVD